MALLQRLLHERIADPEIGRLLDELAPRSRTRSTPTPTTRR